MQKYDIFYFDRYTFDIESGIARFYYHFDDKVFFEEKIYFFDSHFSLRKNIDLDIVNNILFHIHIALGISYYKFYPTKKLILKTGKLDDFQISFWKKFYLNGLGEFFYKNQINPNGLFDFQFEGNTSFEKKDFEISEKYLVPIGGGKDSIVSIELLKKMGKEIDGVTFAVHDNILYENTSQNAQLRRLFIKRELPENIKEIIASGAYNGHVPITGMIAFVLELSCYLYDYKYIVLSNEASANFGNTMYYGIEINHQWSKSLDFEKDFSEYVSKYISEKVKYFSLLRPFYELKIAEFFSKYAKKYFTNFSSCNTNFKIFKKIPPPSGTPFEKGRKKYNPPFSKGVAESQGINSYWCNTCPKCIFVYSILRAFLTTEEIHCIFGKELYEEKELEKLFRELAGISGIKPFECVGTNEEVILAMYIAYKNWQGNLPFILQIFEKEIYSSMNQNDFDRLYTKILSGNREKNMIPKDLEKELQNITI